MVNDIVEETRDRLLGFVRLGFVAKRPSERLKGRYVWSLRKTGLNQALAEKILFNKPDGTRYEVFIREVDSHGN
jgi:hypothetical protein